MNSTKNYYCELFDIRNMLILHDKLMLKFTQYNYVPNGQMDTRRKATMGGGTRRKDTSLGVRILNLRRTTSILKSRKTIKTTK